MKIQTERAFYHSADAVFQAWVSEETVVPPVTRIEKDVRLGGHYRLFVELEHGTMVMDAVYREIDPGRRLVYGWEWNDDGEATEVGGEFLMTADGSRVHLTHSGFSKQDSYDRHTAGWENYFDGLADRLAD